MLRGCGMRCHHVMLSFAEQSATFSDLRPLAIFFFSFFSFSELQVNLSLAKLSAFGVQCITLTNIANMNFRTLAPSVKLSLISMSSFILTFYGCTTLTLDVILQLFPTALVQLGIRAEILCDMEVYWVHVLIFTFKLASTSHGSIKYCNLSWYQACAGQQITDSSGSHLGTWLTLCPLSAAINY